VDPAEIRRITIKGLFSDDTLYEQLVLKGGNALNLVHHIGNRSSLDIDLSLEEDFRDPQDAQERIFRALEGRFREKGLVLVDKRFREIRASSEDELAARWGGYQLVFKVIEQERLDELGGDTRKAQIQALPSGPNQERNFMIQISKFEYCKGKAEADFEDYTIYVYSPAMIAFEKLRAICQQMEEYPGLGRKHRIPRARDFFDITVITTWESLDFKAPENHDLIRRIFEAKAVPLNLIAQIPKYREFHRPDWPQVQNAVPIVLKEFNFYFNFVIQLTELLKPLWIE
jgi:predicted nucleotidyltransferase component of viral defense system